MNPSMTSYSGDEIILIVRLNSLDTNSDQRLTNMGSTYSNALCLEDNIVKVNILFKEETKYKRFTVHHKWEKNKEQKKQRKHNRLESTALQYLCKS